MRNAFMLCIIIAIELIFTSSIYPLPLVGIAGIATQNPRTKMFATLIESHLDNILRLNFITSAEVFEPINSLLLREQLANFNCKEESCLYRYAMNAHISVIILGSVEQRSYSIVLTLSAFGTDVPYFGKTIYKYTASIPTHGFSFTLREHSYIFEEHCARFIAGLLKRYKKPVFIRFQNNQPSLNPSLRTNGIFTAYRPTIGFATKTPKHTPFMQYIPIGTVSIRNGILTSFTPLIKEGDFILVDYSHVADEIYEFYYGRKRELVFSPPNYNDSLFTMIYTPLASLTMPIVSPFLGYLANRDYSGLGLWCINFAPYLYVEIKGIQDRPQLLMRNHRTVSSTEFARYRFSIYMLICGNMSLFVDSFAHENLNRAANYQGIQRYMGNHFTAAYLSLISGGGGHFYRGWRMWGYFYFHANNILLYHTIKEFSPPRNYNETNNTYERESISKMRAYSFLAAYCSLKFIELIHVLLIPDRIQNGTVEESNFTIAPFFSFLHADEQIWGASFTMRF